jgi:protocatechuate 3,4-dioxygenase beta subunit
MVAADGIRIGAESRGQRANSGSSAVNEELDMKESSKSLEPEPLPGVGSQRSFAEYRRYDPGTQPDHLHTPYESSLYRAPKQPLIRVPQTLGEVTGPRFSPSLVNAATADLTRRHAGEPIGERIFVSGRVLDECGRPVRNTLVEVWQANACGRYLHKADQHDAPLDSNFTGTGRVMTDQHGRYQFKTIKPGSYPWRNHYNAWRPAHIHFSLFGPAFATRLVTQMYFPGDPLLPFDPIFNCTADEKARTRLISAFDWDTVVPEYALAYKFDIVLRGRDETPFED